MMGFFSVEAHMNARIINSESWSIAEEGGGGKFSLFISVQLKTSIRFPHEKTPAFTVVCAIH
jgi:hypothetical protein